MFNYLLAAGIGAMSSILANKNVAVYNDGFRPVYTEYFSGIGSLWLPHPLQ